MASMVLLLLQGGIFINEKPSKYSAIKIFRLSSIIPSKSHFLYAEVKTSLECNKPLPKHMVATVFDRLYAIISRI